MNNVNKTSLIILLIGLLILLLTVSSLSEVDKTTVNIISITGSLASFFGLIIAYIQISAIKKTSELTNQTIQDTKDKLLLGISISDVTETIKQIQEIESNLGINKFEVARIRLLDFRERIQQLYSNKEFKEIVTEENYKALIEKINSTLSVLYMKIYQEEYVENHTIDLMEINKELQKISTYLIEVKNKIRYSTI